MYVELEAQAGRATIDEREVTVKQVTASAVTGVNRVIAGEPEAGKGGRAPAATERHTHEPWPHRISEKEKQKGLVRVCR